MRTMTTCHFCGRELDPKAKGTHRLVQGWERVRTTGEGVHPLKERKQLLVFSHDLCLDIHMRTGETIQQGALL